jgi:MFS family permease
MSPHVILLVILFFMIGTTLYGLALFLPSIVNQLGFSDTRTQLLSVGPFAASFCGRWSVKHSIMIERKLILDSVTLISAYLSDRYETRVIPIAIISTIAVVGYAVYLCQ